jgi:hypothetical protein
MAGTSPAMTVKAIPVSSKAGRPAAGVELAMTLSTNLRGSGTQNRS